MITYLGPKHPVTASIMDWLKNKKLNIWIPPNKSTQSVKAAQDLETNSPCSARLHNALLIFIFSISQTRFVMGDISTEFLFLSILLCQFHLNNKKMYVFACQRDEIHNVHRWNHFHEIQYKLNIFIHSSNIHTNT